MQNKTMMRRLSISIEEKNYQDLKKIIGQRKVSKFIDNIIKREIDKRKQELISAYQSSARDKHTKKEADIWEETLEDIDWNE